MVSWPLSVRLMSRVRRSSGLGCLTTNPLLSSLSMMPVRLTLLTEEQVRLTMGVLFFSLRRSSVRTSRGFNFSFSICSGFMFLGWVVYLLWLWVVV